MNEHNDSSASKKRKKFSIDAFEILYLAISAATFSHTVWASSFSFEGPPPLNQTEMILWQIKGTLIAISVDLGMLMAARFIASSKKTNWTMVLAFVIAAISSFYFQMIYILIHTSDFSVSSGVDSYWKTNLTPFVDARVVILPFLLPFLAIIYTIARTGRERVAIAEEAVRKANEPIRVSDVLAQHARPQQQIEGHENQQSLPAPVGESVIDDRIQQAIDALGNAQVDLVSNRFWDSHWQNWSKPYDSKDDMIKAMLTLGKRRTTMRKNRAKKS